MKILATETHGLPRLVRPDHAIHTAADADVDHGEALTLELGREPLSQPEGIERLRAEAGWRSESTDWA